MHPHIIYQIDAAKAHVAQGDVEAPHTQVQIRPRLKQGKECELSRQHQCQRRHCRRGKQRVIQAVKSAAHPLDPEDSHTVHIDAGGDASQIKIQIVRHRNTVVGF